MLAIYAYNAGSTQTQVAADIIAILTGTTDKATLSASCNQSLTDIFATISTATWAVHDAAPATNKKILSQICYDGVKTKYWGLDFNTANTINGGICETWNADTHAGTNMAGVTGTTNAYTAVSIGSTYISMTAGGYFIIYVDANETFIVARTGSSLSAAMHVGEVTRTGIIMHIDKNYPCFFISAPSLSSFGGAMPRIKNPDSAGDSLNTAAYILGANSSTAYTGSAFNSVLTSGARDSDESVHYNVFPCAQILCYTMTTASSYVPRHYLGTLRSNAVISHLGAVFDELILDSVSYVRIANISSLIATHQNNTTHGLFVKKG